MPMIRKKLTLLLVILLGSGLAFSKSPKPQPLFDSQELLELEFDLPYSKLSRDRKGKPVYFPASLTYQVKDGDQLTIPVEVRTRGKTRRQAKICRFPPLRIKFDKKSAKNTVFANQSKLKLVTHCKNQVANDRYVLKEYLAYRIYNLLTDDSLRVRLVKMTYREGDKFVANRYGILLEHWKKVAYRQGGKPIVTEQGIDITKLDHFATSRMALFQYLIGNDDWSALFPAAEDECCHNMRSMLMDNGSVVSLPYDFDYSGLVDTPYAVSRRKSGDVRKRRFNGYCETRSGLDDAVALVQEKREPILALLQSIEDLGKSQTKRTVRYVERFYEVLDDPVALTKRVLDNCRED